MLPRSYGRVPTAGLLALAGLVVLTACADRRSQPSNVADRPAPIRGPAAEQPTGVVPTGYHGRVRGTVTVLESPQHGPQLCAAVAESYPPQCGGPGIGGWRWDDLRAESAGGTTWGTYEVTGTFDGGVFTLTDPARPPQQPKRDPDGPASRCPQPPGGWMPPDPSNATQQALDEAIRVAGDTTGAGGVWIGWLIPTKQITESQAMDPANSVLNVLTTGDLSATEQAVRDVWGGNLCVSPTDHPEAELTRVANDLAELTGALSWGSDVVGGKAQATTWVVTEQMWRLAVDRFGEDVVQLDGVLVPID